MTSGLSFNGWSQSKNKFEGKKEDWLVQKFWLQWRQRLETIQAELPFLLLYQEEYTSLGFWETAPPPHPYSPCFSLMCDLRAETWVIGGVSGQFPRNLNWSDKKEALRTGCYKGWQMLCLIAFFVISVGAPLCNGDIEDTDSRSVDMESIPEQKGQ